MKTYLLGVRKGIEETNYGYGKVFDFRDKGVYEIRGYKELSRLFGNDKANLAWIHLPKDYKTKGGRVLIEAYLTPYAGYIYVEINARIQQGIFDITVSGKDLAYRWSNKDRNQSRIDGANKAYMAGYSSVGDTIMEELHEEQLIKFYIYYDINDKRYKAIDFEAARKLSEETREKGIMSIDLEGFYTSAGSIRLDWQRLFTNQITYFKISNAAIETVARG